MDQYKIVKKGLFERLNSFEERINGLHAEGWKALSITSDNNRMSILMERR
jgi:hypothetical protein